MLLKISATFEIDNPRSYPPEVLNELRGLLARGVSAEPDPNRTNFYDIEVDESTFFIHILPTGTVVLLATWQTCSASLSAA